MVLRSQIFTPVQGVVSEKSSNSSTLLHCCSGRRANTVTTWSAHSQSMSGAGDVEVVVATNVAPARKLSKKQSFTGMPYDDVFCLNKEQAVKLLSHGGLNAKDTEAALQEVRVWAVAKETLTLHLTPDPHPTAAPRWTRTATASSKPRRSGRKSAAS